MADRLFRSRRSRVVGGVAAGLGDYLNIDPVLIRILFVAATIFHGIGILLYIILWIVVPENESEQPEMKVKSEMRNEMDSETSYTRDEVKEEPVNQSKDSSSSINDETKEENKKIGKGRFAAGIILISLGLIIFADKFIPFFSFDLIFPLLLIFVGITLLWNSSRK